PVPPLVISCGGGAIRNLSIPRAPRPRRPRAPHLARHAARLQDVRPVQSLVAPQQAQYRTPAQGHPAVLGAAGAARRRAGKATGASCSGLQHRLRGPGARLSEDPARRQRILPEGRLDGAVSDEGLAAARLRRIQGALSRAAAAALYQPPDVGGQQAGLGMAGKRIGVLTGGGDVPGLNSVIKSAVYRGGELGFEVIGIRKGWEGLTHLDLASGAWEKYVLPLDRSNTR